MYTCSHFKIEELVPPEILLAYGQGAWSLLTDPIKQTADMIREYFGSPMHINRPPLQKYRGYRTPACPEWAPGSQHSIGNAIDFDIDTLTPEYIRRVILNNQSHPSFALIGGLEDFPGMHWVHVDCRARIAGQIVVFSNKKIGGLNGTS